MTEQHLIDLLSEESDKMFFETFTDKDRFDTDICGWKDIPASNPLLNSPPQVPKFRIRTAAKGSLSRSNSSRSHLSTLSSGTSRNSSPAIDPEKCGRVRKNSANFCATSTNPPFPTTDVKILKIHKPPRPRKARKPIKVFKLPNVSQENNE